MEPSQGAAAVQTPQETVAKIDQKALRLSALLREVDNHPIELPHDVVERLDEILEMLAWRIAATRALLHQPAQPAAGTSVA